MKKNRDLANYVEHEKVRGHYTASVLSDVVRVRFDRKKEAIAVHIYIGSNILKELNFKGKEKIKFFYDKKDPSQWFLKKSTDDMGYSLYEHASVKNYCTLSFTLKIDSFIPSEKMFKTVQVEFDVEKSAKEKTGSLFLSLDRWGVA